MTAAVLAVTAAEAEGVVVVVVEEVGGETDGDWDDQ